MDVSHCTPPHLNAPSHSPPLSAVFVRSPDVRKSVAGGAAECPQPVVYGCRGLITSARVERQADPWLYLSCARLTEQTPGGRAGERAREQRRLSQGLLARFLEISLGKQPQWWWSWRWQQSQTRKSQQFHLRFTGFSSAVKSWSQIQLKHPMTETWGLEWRCQVKGYKFDERLDVLLRLQVKDVLQQSRLWKLGSWNKISFYDNKNSSFCTCQAELASVADSW